MFWITTALVLAWSLIEQRGEDDGVLWRVVVLLLVGDLTWRRWVHRHAQHTRDALFLGLVVLGISVPLIGRSSPMPFLWVVAAGTLPALAGARWLSRRGAAWDLAGSTWVAISLGYALTVVAAVGFLDPALPLALRVLPCVAACPIAWTLRRWTKSRSLGAAMRRQPHIAVATAITWLGLAIVLAPRPMVVPDRWAEVAHTPEGRRAIIEHQQEVRHALVRAGLWDGPLFWSISDEPPAIRWLLRPLRGLTEAERTEVWNRYQGWFDGLIYWDSEWPLRIGIVDDQQQHVVVHPSVPGVRVEVEVRLASTGRDTLLYEGFSLQDGVELVGGSVDGRTGTFEEEALRTWRCLPPSQVVASAPGELMVVVDLDEGDHILQLSFEVDTSRASGLVVESSSLGWRDGVVQTFDGSPARWEGWLPQDLPGHRVLRSDTPVVVERLPRLLTVAVDTSASMAARADELTSVLWTLERSGARIHWFDGEGRPWSQVPAELLLFGDDAYGAPPGRVVLWVTDGTDLPPAEADLVALIVGGSAGGGHFSQWIGQRVVHTVEEAFGVLDAGPRETGVERVKDGVVGPAVSLQF
jgi:hypothetical protein